MITMAVILTFYIPKAITLENKKKISRSIINKTRRRFNASISEAGIQDTRQTLSISASVISDEVAGARRILDKLIRYMEKRAGMDLVVVEYK